LENRKKKKEKCDKTKFSKKYGKKTKNKKQKTF
jgi:hypothetical protein